MMMNHNAAYPAPSPLEGEGWGGGFLPASRLLINPPPAALRSAASPARGEAIVAWEIAR